MQPCCESVLILFNLRKIVDRKTNSEETLRFVHFYLIHTNMVAQWV
jgi:hypothetical protein